MPASNLTHLDRCDPRTCISGKVERISRITANIFRKYLKPFQITDSQLSILFILSKHEGLSQKTIGDMAYLEKSSVNRNLQRLLDRELISKEDFPLIKITRPGKVLLNDIIPEWEKAMAEAAQLFQKNGLQALQTLHNQLTNPS